ncbi:hypothetical protein D4R71_01160 [bacterium]|nr:MAG: hypothetical protein D4R71_01160 [bacterium]
MKMGFRIALIIWTILMLTLSSLPNFQAPSLFPKFSDKIAHLIEYGIWATLFLLMLKHEDRIKNLWSVFVTVLICGGILGILDEIHQRFVSGRFMDIYDFFADVIGITVAIIIFRIFYRKPRYYIPERKK